MLSASHKPFGGEVGKFDRILGTSLLRRRCDSHCVFNCWFHRKPAKATFHSLRHFVRSCVRSMSFQRGWLNLIVGVHHFVLWDYMVPRRNGNVFGKRNWSLTNSMFASRPITCSKPKFQLLFTVLPGNISSLMVCSQVWSVVTRNIDHFFVFFVITPWLFAWLVG
jgi:hypothetical protein